MGLGDRIKAKREELGMSQDELAKRMGYSSRSAIAKIERGASDIPYTKIREFANVLNTNVIFLIDGDKYYLNKETEKIAQEAYDNEDIKELIGLIKDMPPEKRKEYIDIMNKVNKLIDR